MDIKEEIKIKNDNRKHVAVIGGGFTGLTVAYRLSKKGIRVSVMESNFEPGGMVTSTAMGNENLERIYHHIFTSDKYVVDLAEELGVADKLSWHKPKDGIYIDGKLFPFSSPMDLITFKPIPFIERIKTGLAVLKAGKVKDIKSLESMTAQDWLIKNSGYNAYKKLWKPLLKSKFDEDADKVSAVWIWNKFKLRGNSRDKAVSGEMLGYMEGSFTVMVDTLIEEIRKNGGEVYTGYTAFDISPIKVKPGLTPSSAQNLKSDSDLNNQDKTEAEKEKFNVVCVLEDCSRVTIEVDCVVGAISSHRFIAMSGGLNLPDEYRHKATDIPFKANLCLLLRLKKSLSKYYWTTISDDFPFVVAVEHTRMTGLKNYDGHIVYLSRYLDVSDDLWNQSDRDIFRLFSRELSRIYPDFSISDVKDWRLSRTRYSQPVIGLNYSEKMPSLVTPRAGVFLAGMVQIYPEDRGMNYAIRLGNEAAMAVENYLNS